MNHENMKMTEVGWIPKDWEVKTLEDIGNFSKGRGVSRDQSHSGNLPCVRYGELYTSHDNYIRNFYSFISQKVADTAKRLNKGDVLFAASGETKEEIGKAVAFVGNEEAYVGGDIIVLSPKIESNSMFLGFVLNGEESVRQKSALGQGDAVVHIHAPELSKVSIPFPPISEQRRIAQVLSDTDSLIASLSRTIEKKRLVKQGAMQQLLTGKTRLKGFSGEWMEKKVSDLVDVKKGFGLSKAKLSPDGQYRCILYGELFTTYNYLVRNCVSRTNYQEGIPSKIGDVLMPGSTTTNGIDLAKAISVTSDDILLGGDVIILRSKNEIPYDSYFLACVLTDTKKKEVEQAAQGITIIHLNAKELANISISLPNDVIEQTAISERLRTMDNEIASLEAELQKYKSLKQGMMQKLLTGQIRLK